MEVNKKYMVVQIGCIECGVSSYPIGIYNTLKKAKKVRKAHPNTWDSEGGQGYTEIWMVNTGNNYVEILPIKEDTKIKEDSTAGFTEWEMSTNKEFIFYDTNLQS